MSTRLALALSLSLGALAGPACLDAGDDGAMTTPDLALDRVESTFAYCSSLTGSSLALGVTNLADRPITLVSVEVTSASAHVVKTWASGAELAAGVARHFTCVGGISEALGGPAGSEPSSAVVTYRIDGAERTVVASGTHTTTPMFDSCDTGLPQVDETPCAPTPPR